MRLVELLSSIGVMPDTQHFVLPADDAHIEPALFDPAHLALQNTIDKRLPAGRGEVIFFQHNGHSLVLRHYRRGGFPARISDDYYVWTGLESSRPWREYRLLEHLQSNGLPAPRAYAAHVQRSGLVYSGDIITHKIEGTHSMADWLRGKPIPPEIIANIGFTIRRFHNHAVDHVDLNANNILITDTGAVWLVDFDRCRIRENGRDNWKQNNLNRLQRSLSKLQAKGGTHFSDNEWTALEEGYQRDLL